MPAYSKPHGDFQNQTQIADATQVNDQINQLYTAVNGGLDGTNVPNLGDMTTVTTTAKNAAGAINELQALPVFSMSRQALINGNFDVWQEGVTFNNPANGTYIAEMFANFFGLGGGIAPTSLVHSQLVLSPGDILKSSDAHRLTTNGSGSGFGPTAFYGLFNRIENGTRYLAGLSKKVTVSFYARSSIANKRLGVSLQQNYGSGGSPSALEDTTGGTAISLTSTWTRYSVTFNTNTLVGKTFGLNNDDYLQVGFYHMWGTTVGTNSLGGASAETFLGSGTIDIAQVQVNAGDQALLFQPRSFADELALCHRYFEKSYDLATVPGASGTMQGFYFNFGSPCSATALGGAIQYKVRKRGVPTVTIYDMVGAIGKVSAWNGTAQTNGLSAALDQGTEQKCRILVGVTSGNFEIFGHFTANARM